MTRFEFKCTQGGSFSEPERVVTFTTNAHQLNEVLEEFQTFLRGCGYFFDGVEFVQDDRPFQTNI